MPDGPPTLFSPDPAIIPLLKGFQGRHPLRTGSLLVTLFGDVIHPRGGEVWLGDVLAFMERCFGLNRRQVRTAMVRLVKDGWLDTESVGRRALYRITAAGKRRFETATRRIYAETPPAWAGQWTLILIPSARRDQRESARKELIWAGFGHAGPGLWLHPSPDPEEMAGLMSDLGPDGALVLDGQAAQRTASGLLHDLAADAWDLAALAALYEELLDRLPDIDSMTDLAPENALLGRILLVHEYRRILLRDPMLPTAMLQEDWPGALVRRRVAALYRTVSPAARRAIAATLGNNAGPLPAVLAGSGTRFGLEV